MMLSKRSLPSGEVSLHAEAENEAVWLWGTWLPSGGLGKLGSSPSDTLHWDPSAKGESKLKLQQKDPRMPFARFSDYTLDAAADYLARFCGVSMLGQDFPLAKDFFSEALADSTPTFQVMSVMEG